ncbi:MAG: right-handed parallel beta-helix repeat-containing protein [Anaerolineae bacterium]|nr:right-handed parallel beta-helix repeat-containing protein [Anaerolineae bacterium]MBL8106842.1 right-handed parallel beta-helix repeat-containing protein [Anaerolineales bacterium]MCC7187419.1 right-handed parallel beta-helix repeat-containing protein [Anaerolineales bacterium]
MKIWIKRIFLILGLLALVGIFYAAFAPLPFDELPPEEKWGAGASSVLPAYSGLQREFPALNGDTSPEKAKLGRLLFFDPILSKNQDMSCATCHNPSLGFSDGLQTAKGSDGSSLPRNTPTLWNAGYSTKLFWDGRADSLEAQMSVPLHAENEMAGSDAETVARLMKIPEYVELFNKAFGNNAITVENAQTAIASFERTLVSNNSPFDKYAAGQFDALTSQQRRGLNLFRSAATRCFECHAAPTFGSDDFFVTGSPDLEGFQHDEGRAAIASDGQDGAFKAPTLRNVALTGPYMHNGAFATLDDVLWFYEKGGGSQYGLEVDRHILPIELSAQEHEDLVAFLYALTDESAMPEIPTSVPSGLPVVEQYPNLAREVVSQLNVEVTESGIPAHEPTVVRVGPKETIQQAVDRSGPGDTIEVPYGIYHESVVLDWSDVKLVGIPNDQGEWPVIDGEGTRSDGVIASGNNFEMYNFAVKNYTSNGVLVEGATGVYLHDLYIENTGVYGVYPVRCTDVLIERIEATLMNDAAVYAGKSENVVIRDTLTYGNVIGVELENTVNGEVYNNVARDNTVGIFIDLLPQLPSKVSLYTKVYDNVVENNNGENFGKPGTAVALAPSGTGILILAADEVEVYNNTIRGNKSGGLAVFNLTIGFDVNEIDVGPNPEHVYAHDNIYENNGYDADPFVKKILGRGFDIIWDSNGADNYFDEEASSSFPPILPKTSWPQPLYNLYWRFFNFVVGLAG